MKRCSREGTCPDPWNLEQHLGRGFRASELLNLSLSAHRHYCQGTISAPGSHYRGERGHGHVVFPALFATAREVSSPAGFFLWLYNFCMSATDRQLGAGLWKVSPVESCTWVLLGDFCHLSTHGGPSLAVVLFYSPNSISTLCKLSRHCQSVYF